MIHETDAVIAARRETWKKALAAVRSMRKYSVLDGSDYGVCIAIAALVGAAEADGVSSNETSP